MQNHMDSTWGISEGWQWYRRVFLRDNTFTVYVHFMTAEEEIQLEWAVTPLKAVGRGRKQG